jgi:hypothetical protein
MDRLAALEARIGVRLIEGTEPVIARFAERVRAVSMHVGTDDIERVLDGAAAEIERMAKKGDNS